MGSRKEDQDSRDLELLIREHVEELVAAGAGQLLTSTGFAALVANLALNCFDEVHRPGLTKPALKLATYYLLPEETKRAGIEVDAGTLDALLMALR